MMGTAVQLGRRHGADRFCDAAKARRSLPTSRCATTEKSPEEQSAGPPPPPCGGGNLERFVTAVAPAVPAQYLSNSAVRGRRSIGGVDGEMERPYFVLGDVWEAYREWSAYGAGVPLMLDGCDGVVQYYVPYLSAIQLYGDPAILHACPKERQMMEDSDGDCQDSSSDGSSDYGHERVKLLSSQEGFSSDDSESGHSHGRLLFQYLEFDSPFCREPLTDKISNLSARFPGLKTLRSCDLSPRSWISVAWYPIYRIPTGSTLRDLDACFLTFHFLSTLPKGGTKGDIGDAVPTVGVDGTPTMSLPVFGMASYKLKSSMWSSTDGEWQLASRLLQTAADWLQHIHASHPDYQFFVSRGASYR